MLPYKPHTCTIEPISDSVQTDGSVETPAFGTAVTYACMAVPETPGQVYEKFGVTLDRPYVFYFDSVTETLCPAGSRITYGGELYHSNRPPIVWAAIPAINCSVVLAEKAQFQPNV